MQCVHMSVCECGCVQAMERVHVPRESQAWTQLVRLTQQALLLTGPIAPFPSNDIIPIIYPCTG